MGLIFISDDIVKQYPTSKRAISPNIYCNKRDIDFIQQSDE